MPNRRFLRLSLVLVATFLLGGCNLQNVFDKEPAGLDITTDPTKAKVFLNNKEVGETPYKNKNIKAGEYILKLVPDPSDSNTPLPAWETKLTLFPKVTTNISRSFSASLADVESAIISLYPERGGSHSAFLSVISDPDTVNISLDNKPHGFTPLSKLEVTPGDHHLYVSSPGYKPKSLSIKTAKGYNLLVSLKLASERYDLSPSPIPSPSPPTTEELPSPTPSPSPLSSSPAPSPQPQEANINPPYVLVQDTPDTRSLGGLNVRTEPTSSSSSLGLAKIGAKLPYQSTNATGWHEVIFEGKTGWVSGKYTSVVKN